MATRRLWGWVYFVGVPGARGPIKIGWTKKPEQRLRGIQNGSAERLEVLLAFHGAIDEEHWLHRYFAARRMRSDGEWFERSNEMLAFIGEMLGETWQEPPAGLRNFFGRQVYELAPKPPPEGRET